MTTGPTAITKHDDVPFNLFRMLVVRPSPLNRLFLDRLCNAKSKTITKFWASLFRKISTTYGRPDVQNLDITPGLPFCLVLSTFFLKKDIRGFQNSKCHRLVLVWFNLVKKP